MGYHVGSPMGDLSFSTRDSAFAMPKCVVVGPDDFDWQGDTPPNHAGSETLIYEAHVKGLTAMHPERRTLAPRHLPRPRQSEPVIDHLKSARRHRHRAPAGPCLRRRPVPRRTGPAQLLGLPDDRLLRARTALSRPGRHPRIQGDGARAAQGRDRGDPRRGLQPHRRGRRLRARRCQLPRARQRLLLPAGAGQAALHQRYRHRQRARSSTTRRCCAW